MLRSVDWWNIYSVQVNITALNIIFLAFISLTFGTLFFEKISKEKNLFKFNNHFKKSNFLDQNIKFIRKVSFILMIICFINLSIVEIDKLLFMSGRAYIDYYSEYMSRVPYAFSLISRFYSISLIFFLATFPTKNKSIFALVLYIFSTIPMLKIGVRNPFVLSCLFTFIYCFLRDNVKKKEEKKWIGKFEKSLIIFLIPISVVGMSVFGYFRSNDNVPLNPTIVVHDFLFEQGTTYETLLQGIYYKESMPGRAKNYTFGELTDKIKYSRIGNVIFKTDNSEIGGRGNSIKKAFNSSSFAHAISYKVLESKYISGVGRGGCYLAENYLDYGFTGIVFFNFIFGFLISFLTITFKQSYLKNLLTLLIFSNILFMPRETTTLVFLNILSPYFWVYLVGMALLYFIYIKVLQLKKSMI